MKSKDYEVAEYINNFLKNEIIKRIKNIKSNYFKKYINRIFKNESTILLEVLKYKKLIRLITNKSDNNNFIIIDLGGCHGFLSYLLSQYTNNEIIMLEPFNESVLNCKKIWNEIESEKISFLNGDYNKIIKYLNANKNKKISNILSYDVFEHIGNIEEFFNLEQKISNFYPSKFIHASGANPYNLRNKIRDIKHQFWYEYIGNSYKGMKSTSTQKSYFSTRFNEYNKYYENIYSNKIIRFFKGILFSFITRGLTKEQFQVFLKIKLKYV